MGTSGTQLKSCREEEVLGVVADGPFRTIAWAIASQYHAFGRSTIDEAEFYMKLAFHALFLKLGPTQLKLHGGGS